MTKFCCRGLRLTRGSQDVRGGRIGEVQTPVDAPRDSPATATTRREVPCLMQCYNRYEEAGRVGLSMQEAEWEGSTQALQDRCMHRWLAEMQLEREPRVFSGLNACCCDDGRRPCAALANDTQRRQKKFPAKLFGQDTENTKQYQVQFSVWRKDPQNRSRSSKRSRMATAPWKSTTTRPATLRMNSRTSLRARMRFLRLVWMDGQTRRERQKSARVCLHVHST